MPAVAKPGRSPQTLPHQVLLALLLLVEPPSGLQPSPRGLSLGVAPSRPWATTVTISRHQCLGIFTRFHQVHLFWAFSLDFINFTYFGCCSHSRHLLSPSVPPPSAHPPLRSLEKKHFYFHASGNSPKGQFSAQTRVTQQSTD